MENLFIIGNGFDLAHGLPTSYRDFKSYVKGLAKQDNIDELLEETIPDEIPSDYLSPRGDIRFNIDKLANFYYRLINTLEYNAREREKYLNLWSDRTSNKYENWNGFEEYLGLVTDVIDWEEGLKMYDREGDLDPFKTANNLEDEADVFGQFFRDATNYLFSKWINSIIDTGDYQDLFPSKPIVKDWKEYSYFLTFNYTLVLEEIYRISPERVCHIHGQVGGGIIVGHNRQLLTYHDNPIDRATYHDMILEDVRKPTKDCYQAQQIFFNQLHQIKRLIFIGFNLDSPDLVDRYYFEQLFTVHLKRKPVEIIFDKYHWQAGEVPIFLNTLTSLGANIKSFTVLGDENVEFIK